MLVGIMLETKFCKRVILLYSTFYKEKVRLRFDYNRVTKPNNLIKTAA